MGPFATPAMRHALTTAFDNSNYIVPCPPIKYLMCFAQYIGTVHLREYLRPMHPDIQHDTFQHKSPQHIADPGPIYISICTRIRHDVSGYTNRTSPQTPWYHPNTSDATDPTLHTHVLTTHSTTQRGVTVLRIDYHTTDCRLPFDYHSII